MYARKCIQTHVCLTPKPKPNTFISFETACLGLRSVYTDRDFIHQRYNMLIRQNRFSRFMEPGPLVEKLTEQFNTRFIIVTLFLISHL